MASFFQPPTSGDPVIIACNQGRDGSSPGREIYCNRALAADHRLDTPAQYFTLAFAAACLGLPLIVFVAIRIYRLLKAVAEKRGRR